MKKMLFFITPFLLSGTMVSASCTDYEDGSVISEAPRFRICYDDVCDETQLSWVCSNINGTRHQYANGWATDYTSPQSGEESYTVTWQGRTIDEEKHSRLSIEEIDRLEEFAEQSFQQTLFSCTLAGGENSVQVLYFSRDDSLTYAYANAQGKLELNLNSPVETVAYSPFAWDRGDITESVKFYNGDTSYEVFSTMTRSGFHLIGGSVGGVVVTTPSGQSTELQCDAYSVEPANVFQGIGRLASLKDENHDAFDQCLSSELSATACMGVYAAECHVNPNDEFDCLKAEQDRWQGVLAETLTETFLVTGGQQFSLVRSEDVERAQQLWEESRDFDCEISAWTNYNVLDGDLGKLSCLSDYTAQRVDFLRSMQSGMEFDG